MLWRVLCCRWQHAVYDSAVLTCMLFTLKHLMMQQQPARRSKFYTLPLVTKPWMWKHVGFRKKKLKTFFPEFPDLFTTSFTYYDLNLTAFIVLSCSSLFCSKESVRERDIFYSEKKRIQSETSEESKGESGKDVEKHLCLRVCMLRELL